MTRGKSRAEATEIRPDAFYASAMTEAERVRLPRARQMEGLDEEIALLRVRLGSLVEEQPQNTELLLKGIGMLVRAVSARYKLSPQAKDNLADAITHVLKEIGGALWPEGFPGPE
ncbi:MAG: hypothetical protein HY669_02860 [Chloroflexi bacterium]|nr:hypothetical protein [Chloroflexota bacterium]